MAKKTSAARKSAAKKHGTTKAQAIRDAAQEIGGKPRPKDIIAALAAKQIIVTSPQVISVLKAAGLYRRRRKARSGGVAKKISGNGRSHALNINDLIQVKELAAKLGGTDKLKEAITAFERLR